MYEIPESNMFALSERIAKLARRAVKLGFVPPAFVVRSEFMKPIVLEGGIKAERKYFVVEIVGEAPVIEGYSLLAVIEHGDSEVGNVVRTVPGKECPKEFRCATPYCEHCGTSRRRLETFIIAKDGEAPKQIGRNCLADYCRSKASAEDICAYMTVLADFEESCRQEGENHGFSFIPYFDTVNVLARTVKHVNAFGWRSRTKAREFGGCATADIVRNEFVVQPHMLSPQYKALAEEQTTEDEVKEAETALEWIRAMKPQADTLGDYLHNLLVVANSDNVSTKHFGILCSLIATYRRHIEGEREKVVIAQRPASEWVGKVGDRESWVVTLLRQREFQGQDFHGRDQLQTTYTFLLNDRDQIIWWTAVGDKINDGDEVLLTGTVKAHKEYNGQKQTTVSRCSIAPVVRCVKCGAVRVGKNKKCRLCKTPYTIKE